MKQQQTEPIPFTGYQKLVLFLLAITQFTVILDFMVMSPLGDMLMKSMDLKPSAFGVAVSAYAISAGISGLLTAGFADKFDRKKLLLFFYTGFIAGSIFCGLSHSFVQLVAARIVTGLFGGVIGSISMAIVTDLFAIQQRGRVMGYLQMGFGASQVLGIPIGLYLANLWGWEMPFFMVGGLAILVALVIMLKMQPVDKHLALQHDKSVLTHLWHTLARREYRVGFMATALLSIGGFMMMPFGSAFAINNLGVTNAQLPLLFMISGISSLIVMPLVGRLSDKISRIKLYLIASVWTMIMCVVYTNLTLTPFWLVVVLNVLMMAGVLTRMIPSSALISSVPDMEDRGAFMSVNSSLQQIAGGIAATVAGMIVLQPTKFSPLQNYNVVGYVIVVISIISILLLYRVSKMVDKKTGTNPPVVVEDEVVVSEGY
ncbi:MFS transporter [Mucilaginibacter mali]|uniref:MFS transporter n=1 Tax=Mucilaginibacter mali TaxID=2740462 RepID=A0A7D4Q7A9_9SPHI|nr:MFS transporter [Mucilaginibacter mali]QKJ29911.1 MFS transporter [Mucilaginibacter mali]